MKRIRQRLQDERGIALVMALGIMTVILIATTTAAYVATQNQKSAYYARDAQVSYSVAEAGLNNAMSRLHAASDPLSPSAVPSTTETVGGGTTTYSGSLSGPAGTGYIWTLTATSSVRNPTGGAPIVRTVSQQVEVIPGGVSMGAWAYNYSDATTGCMPIAQNATISAPLYVRGNLCLANDSHITGSPLQVGGKLTVGNNGSVGFPSAKIAQAKLAGGCTGGNPNPHPCTAGDRVYANQITTTTDGLTKPPADFAYWYQNADPGPMHPCTVGSVPGGFDNNSVMNWSRPTFNLTPTTAYSCTTANGRLSWTPGNPGTLIVDGTIFFDGSIVMNIAAYAVYTGQATIYASGSVTLSNDAKLCGIVGCTNQWNTALNILMLVAGDPTGDGFFLSNNAVYQGAAYAVANYHAENNAVNWGPVVANQIQIDNEAGQTISLSALPPGAPISGIPSFEIVPNSYSG